MVDLVGHISVRFVKFPKFNLVLVLLNFRPAERPLGRLKKLAKTVLLNASMQCFKHAKSALVGPKQTVI